MVDRIVAEVPTYRRASPDVIDDVLVLSTATAELLGQAFAAGSPVQREDVPVVREHAARRVHQGVDLEAFLHAYRAALFAYWDACAEEASRLTPNRPKPSISGQNAEQPEAAASHGAESSRPAS
jgi:hypothetical protein